MAMLNINPHKLAVGDKVKTNCDALVQDKLNRFGNMLGTNGKIHTDPEFAKTAPAGDVLVQGMLVLAPLHSVFCTLFGEDVWLTHGAMECKLIGATHPSEAITYDVEITAVEPNRVTLDYSCIKANDTKVAVGTATVGIEG
jgi:acyl dehydratase